MVGWRKAGSVQGCSRSCKRSSPGISKSTGQCLEARGDVLAVAVAGRVKGGKALLCWHLVGKGHSERPLVLRTIPTRKSLPAPMPAFLVEKH